MIAQEEKELLISFSQTNSSDIVISVYYENEKSNLFNTMTITVSFG